MSAKPQLVISDFSGHHAANLPETAARLHRGGSWKKQRIITVIPAADLVPAKCVLSWLSLAYPPNNGVVRILALGQEVGDAYSTAIEQVLANPELSQWEYLLTVEHDNAPPSDGVIRLVDRMEEYPDAAAISGLYFTKGMPSADGVGGGVAQCWGSPDLDPVVNFRPAPPRVDGGMMRVWGIGMGFSLWRLAMFRNERVQRPWFRTKRGLNGEGVGTQDLVAAQEFGKYGYKFYVDCGCKVGHYDLKGDFGIPDMMY